MKCCDWHGVFCSEALCGTYISWFSVLQGTMLFWKLHRAIPISAEMLFPTLGFSGPFHSSYSKGTSLQLHTCLEAAWGMQSAWGPPGWDLATSVRGEGQWRPSLGSVLMPVLNLPGFIFHIFFF